MQQSSSPCDFWAISQEVSYHCYIIQPLSLRQERMALKLISARLQLVLLHAKRSRIVVFCFEEKGAKGVLLEKKTSAKRCCGVFVCLS